MSNFAPYRTPMPEKDIKSILNVSFRILENIGMKVPHKRVLDIISSSGVKIDPIKSIVKFPRKVVEASIEKTKIELLEKDKNAIPPKKDLEKTIEIFPSSLGGNMPSIWDMETRKVRSAKKQDLLDAIKISNILGFGGGTIYLPSDVPPHTEDVNALACALKYCNNPPQKFHRIANTESVKPLFDLMSVVAGSSEKVRKEERLIYCCNSISPLMFSHDDLERLLTVYDMGCVVRFTGPMVIAGAGGPASWAGSYALTYAELLASMVMTHAFGFGGAQISMSPMVMDMSSGLACYVDPKMLAGILFQRDFSKHLYGIETSTWGPIIHTDACYPGIQAGVEKLRGLFMHMLNQPEQRKIGFGYVGVLACQGFGSFPQIFIDLEIIDMLNNFFRSLEIRVDEETLAEELINKVGIGGTFMAEEHTVSHFRETCWQPKLFRKEYLYQNTACDSVLEEAIKLSRIYLKKDWPESKKPLDADQIKEIDRIVEMANRSALK